MSYLSHQTNQMITPGTSKEKPATSAVRAHEKEPLLDELKTAGYLFLYNMFVLILILFLL